MRKASTDSKKTVKAAKKSKPVVVYAPDESLKKKLGIGKTLRELITPSVIKKATKKSKKSIASLQPGHSSAGVPVARKSKSKKKK